ncbi:MAG: calcium/sodium antiporter [Clostridia bacterium]|nr:calcium/sodium antiporter [Clostridia bacterium]
MKTVLDVVLLVVGFVLLLKGADFLVDGAVGFARKFHIPTLVIGMTIVAFGTSAPEAAVSITAALAGSNEISVSNILGSNLFNLLVVGGVCAVIRPLPIQRISVTRDYPFHLVITAVLLVLCLDTVLGGGQSIMLTRADGLILLLCMGIYMYINICDGIKGEEKQEEAFKFSFIKSLLFFLGGLAGVVIGGDLVVDSATGIARAMGISDTLIGLTVVALGTSLPELMTSAVACKKGEADLAWGNIVGSNVFNILFVMGISALISPVAIDMASVYDMVILLIVGTAVYLATAHSKRISRPVGSAMLVTYLVYLTYIILR